MARRQAAEDAAKEKAAGGGGLSLFSRSAGQARQQQQQQQSSLMSRWASPSGGGLDGIALDQAAPGVTALRGEGLQQPALRGKLQEVDLGQEMRSRNVVLTQRATRKGGGGGGGGGHVEGDDDDDEGDEDAAGGGEGSASKPAAAKGRKRRASDDAIRDKMVEEFLRENKGKGTCQISTQQQIFCSQSLSYFVG